MGTRPGFRAALAAVAALVAGACGGGGSPAPPPPATVPVPGATQVTGRERFAWEHDGNGTSLSYRVYIDGVGATLESATCVVDGAESRCSAPLPAMSDGVHALELAAVNAASGVEGERSAAITLQKVAVRATRAVSALPNASGDGVAAFGFALTTSSTADIVARDVHMPAQLAPLPDGRLLLAEQGGRVRLLDPSARQPAVEALDLGRLVDPAPFGAVAIAAHPDFAATRHVFVSDLYASAAGEMRLRIVRMREVGDRLGEPARIFDAAVTVDGGSAVAADVQTERLNTSGPRLAFGPDGLLYAVLPQGFVFDGQPAASRPVPAIVRLQPDGRTPAEGPLAGITSHPLGFTWHPSTGELLGLITDGPSDVAVRVLGIPAETHASATTPNVRFRAERNGSAPVLYFEAVEDQTAFGLARMAALVGASQWPRTVRLGVAADVAALMPGLEGRLTDLVTQAGTAYAVVSDAQPGSGGERARGVVVRLRP